MEVGLPAGAFALLQLLLNILLFVPWGVFWRRFLHRGILTATLSGFAMSVVIESAQLTGLFGIYPCAYRTFDGADIVLNTTGALVGAILAPAVLWWMPNAHAIAAKRHEPRPVTNMRRWIGMGIDLVGFAVLSTLGSTLTISIIYLIDALRTGAPPEPIDLSDPWRWWLIFVTSNLIPWISWVVIPALGDSGASPGQTAMWLEPRWRNRKGHVLQRLWRANVIIGPAMVVTVIEFFVGSTLVATTLAGILILASFLLVPATRNHRSLSGLASGCDIVDIREPRAEQHDSTIDRQP